jgi:RHS repeat-associated protein
MAWRLHALNRLETVTSVDGITSYSYDAVGNRATQVNANGTTATYQYDSLNRLIDLTHTDSSNNIIASYAYTLGANGNRLRIEEATGRAVDYSYDELYRLISETVTDAVNGDHYTEFSYDAVGNRLQQYKDGITTTYSYSDNDLLLTETENGLVTSYIYDTNGNTLSKSVDGAIDTEYIYNSENRLIQAITSSSTIDYTYDANGIRQSQNVDGITTNYLVDPNRSYAQVLEEQDSSGTAQVVYVYGDDLLTQSRNGQTTTYGYDGLGSTRILTDETGSVQNYYAYEAFGELSYQIGTVENSYLFTGEQYDNNVGFYYLRARYYNPNIGRMHTMDTYAGRMHEPVTLHKYLYANGNPVMFVDPSGYVGIMRLLTATNVAANIQTYTTIGVNILTGNYAVAAGQIAEEVVFAKLGALGRPISKMSEKATNLFYNVLGRNVKLRLGKKASGTTLAHNLQQVGVTKPPNTSAHHIVAGKGERAQRARDILEDFDIDINSPNNGVFLANRASSPAIGAIHSGGHTHAYFDEINERLINAAASGDKVQVLNELGQIKLDLLSGILTVQNKTR